jgi:molybdate transport system substrate-binding protein
MSMLEVMSARAVKAAVSAIADEFTQATGHQVAFEFAPVGTLEAKLAAGAAPDVIILSTAALAAIQGSLVPTSNRVLGRTSIGVAVREGAPLPDISTADAFRAHMLAAGSIAMSDLAVGGSAGKHLTQLFARLGIADAVDGKAVWRKSGGDVALAVAGGDAEIGLTFISEMLPIAGARVVGPLPPPLGGDTVYAAGVWATSREGAAAAALIAAFTDPDARTIWNVAGFEVP